jgi:hypothetical protein
MDQTSACLGSLEQGASLYEDSENEIRCYKWIESEKAGRDLGVSAEQRWVKEHWWGYLRTRWVEHLEGKRRWKELGVGFGLLRNRFDDNTLLLDRILDRFKAGKENLDIINWALDWGIPVEPLIQILEAIDINSCRLAHRYHNQS